MTVAESLFQAVVDGDVETMLSCFTADAVYHDLLIGTARGEAELRVLFERMVAECLSLEMTTDRIVGTPEIEFAEWTSRYTIGASVPGVAGQSVGVRGVSIFELSNGRCSVYREYFDRGKALADMGLSAAEVYRVLSRAPRS